MNKRALMLTAATTALLSGQAFGQTNPNPPCTPSTSATTYSTTTPQLCDITTSIGSNPLYTGTATMGVTGAYGGLGNFTIDTDGSLTISTSPPTAPAVTINSGTTSAPATLINTTQINYENVSYAVGALLEEASVPTAASTYGKAEYWTGELDGKGTIDLLGTGNNKVGILIAGGAYAGTDASTPPASAAIDGNYASVASLTPNVLNATPSNLGVFTGIVPTTGGDPIAINLEAASVLEVQGTASYGVYLIGPTYTTVGSAVVPTGGGSLIGDIDIAGSLNMTPTTVNTSSTSNIALYLAGWVQSSAQPYNPALATAGYANAPYAMIGNIDIEQGGSISSQGEGSQGIVILGAINGAFINSGELETLGTTTPSTALNAADPEAGAALLIANNLTGGIYNDGSTGASTGARGTIATFGQNTIDITTSYNSNAPLPITIGTYAGDAIYGSTDTNGPQFSILNRGGITAAGTDANVSTTDISISGTSADSVTLTGGIFNSGSMTAQATTNVDAPGSITATTLYIGPYVSIGSGISENGTAQLINSNETGSGLIQATVSGDKPGTATAILIEPSASSGFGLTSIYNSGTISASATTTDPTIANIAAYAIDDNSGTLTTITNQGTISAVATVLDNNAQTAIAIDTANNNTTSVTVIDQATQTNSASINGDVYFGSLPGTLTVSGVSVPESASVTGNIYFFNSCTSSVCPVSNPDDTLTINKFGTVTGEVVEKETGLVDITINPNGTLNLLTSLPTNLNSTQSALVTAGTPLNVGTLTVASGGVFKETLSQGFNVNAFPGISVINAKVANIGDSIGTQTLQLAFGSFVSAPSNGGTSSFVLIATPSGNLTVSATELNSLETSIQTNQSNAIPFLFTGSVCTYNVSTATSSQMCPASTPEPISSSDSEIVLNLSPKTVGTGTNQIPLTGYAAKMFPYVNEALVNDNTLGATMITDITDTAQAQAAYAAFAPDVSGATRATAISLTDSATDIVAARQRELRMYVRQDGDTTLWGQQFGERLSQGNQAGGLTGYNDSGFGFVMGMDDGDSADGRYGGAFTFFAGGMSQKPPTQAKTSSEYYLLTGYTDWRGKGLFIDTQATVGYGNLKGRRYLTLDDAATGSELTREADGNRPTELLAGSITTGGIFNAGGTVFMPQLSIDGMTMREEGYTEANGGDGFDLQVQPYYADSLRAFLGADVRQDVNFGDFFLQPELRAGYRYDFVDGAVKLKANFASVSSVNDEKLDQFTIEGPDPGRGNLVLGGGLAITTGAWSIGVSYDYVRSGGPTEQSGVLTLVGRI